MRSKVSANPSKRPSQRSRSPASQADFRARARANVPVIIPFQHPLSWWRTRPADQFKETDVDIARHFLMSSAIIGEPHWFLGAAGNAAIAVGVALRAQRRKGNAQKRIAHQFERIRPFQGLADRQRMDREPGCIALSAPGHMPAERGRGRMRRVSRELAVDDVRRPSQRNVTKRRSTSLSGCRLVSSFNKGLNA
jgi:hypothetical protein